MQKDKEAALIVQQKQQQEEEEEEKKKSLRQEGGLIRKPTMKSSSNKYSGKDFYKKKSTLKNSGEEDTPTVRKNRLREIFSEAEESDDEVISRSVAYDKRKEKQVRKNFVSFDNRNTSNPECTPEQPTTL